METRQHAPTLPCSNESALTNYGGLRPLLHPGEALLPLYYGTLARNHVIAQAIHAASHSHKPAAIALIQSLRNFILWHLGDSLLYRIYALDPILTVTDRADRAQRKRTSNSHDCKLLILTVIPAGFEPTTHSLEGCCSIQLSYGTITCGISSAKAVAKINLLFLFSKTNCTLAFAHLPGLRAAGHQPLSPPSVRTSHFDHHVPAARRPAPPTPNTPYTDGPKHVSSDADTFAFQFYIILFQYLIAYAFQPRDRGIQAPNKASSPSQRAKITSRTDGRGKIGYGRLADIDKMHILKKGNRASTGSIGRSAAKPHAFKKILYTP